jgi:hypothetical protein
MITLNNLPPDILEILNIKLCNIQNKLDFKNISKYFNENVIVDYNFENKFKLFAEQNNFDLENIDLSKLRLFDKNLKNNILSVKFNSKIIDFNILYTDFDLMLPFSNIYNSSFKIYSKIKPNNWVWYHNDIEFLT